MRRGTPRKPKAQKSPKRCPVCGHRSASVTGLRNHLTTSVVCGEIVEEVHHSGATRSCTICGSEEVSQVGQLRQRDELRGWWALCRECSELRAAATLIEDSLGLGDDASAADAPYLARRGLCHCGCGEQAPLAKDTARGNVAGEPLRYIPGHRPPSPNGYNHCQ